MKTRYARVLVLSALLLFAACRAGTKTDSSGTTEKKEFKVAFITNNSADFWTIARAGVEKADSELADVSAEFRLTSDGSAAEQRRILDDLMTKGVDAVAISPVDPENQAGMLNEAAKRALIFTQDSDAPNSDRACYIGTDNVAAGRQAGELVKEVLPGEGKIMLFVGKLDALNAKQRIQGIKEALQGTKIEIVDIRTDDTDSTRAKSNAADAIVKYPDIKALVGLWSYNGPAILDALKDSKKTGRIKVVTFDEAEETLAGIEDGFIHGTVVQQPYEFGYQAVKLLSQALKGDRSFIPASKQIIVPTLVVKKADVAEFKAKLKALRGKK
jgi:ribose transport system substrate-binding protein